jgi:hypothetical protein
MKRRPKIWLTGISPMVWRRVLVPTSFTLRELHGVIQVAMGWEGIHLYDFQLGRKARLGEPIEPRRDQHRLQPVVEGVPR